MSGTDEGERDPRLYVENADGTLERVYSVLEAGERLGLSYGGVIKLLQRDVLAAQRWGGQVWLIRESDLRCVQEARTTLRPKTRSNRSIPPSKPPKPPTTDPEEPLA